MTKKEATAILGQFRKAFEALDRVKAFSAVGALVLTQSGPMTTDSAMPARFSSALNDLKMVFDAIDRKS
jgi:hypothetical protein